MKGGEHALFVVCHCSLLNSHKPVMSKLQLAKRALPSKEGTLFKEVLTLYETRQLKKGLKTADQIIKKFPQHGGISVSS